MSMRRAVIAVLSSMTLATCAPAADGKILLGEPMVVSDPGSGWPIAGVDVAYDATSNRYLVAWSGAQGVFVRALDRAARPAGNQLRIADRSAVRVVHGPPGEFLVLSSERGPAGISRLVGRRVGPAGESRGEPFVVSDQPAPGATVAYNPIRHEYLVAWAGERIHAQRLDRTGNRLGAPAPISGTPRALGSPVLAHNTVA